MVPSLYGCPLGFMFVFGSHGSCLDASIAVISLQELPNLFSVSFSACYVCVLFDSVRADRYYYSRISLS